MSREFTPKAVTNFYLLSFLEFDVRVFLLYFTLIACQYKPDYISIDRETQNRKLSSLTEGLPKTHHMNKKLNQLKKS